MSCLSLAGRPKPPPVEHSYRVVVHDSDYTEVLCPCGWSEGWSGGDAAVGQATAAGERHEAKYPKIPDAPAAQSPDLAWTPGLVAQALLVVVAFVGVIYIVGSAVLSFNDGASNDPGPTGKYSETECTTLAWKASGDDDDAEDAAVQHGVHCE